MDIEWGKDGATGKIYILQARPETVQSRAGRTIQRFTLKARSKMLITGRSIGQRIGAGPARIIKDVKEMSRVRAGDVLVADMTDPDWEPVMKRASAIVTNRGGSTCHAAIIARELGIPAVVGCGTATTAIKEGQPSRCPAPRATPAMSTTACSNSTSAPSSWIRAAVRSPVKIMMNVGNPDRAFDFAGSRTRRRACAPGIHHQPHDRRASARAPGIRQAERRAQGHHHQANRGLQPIR